MAYLHAEARERGADRVRLRVDPDNVRARPLYGSLGHEYQGEYRGELAMVVSVGSRK
jgi:RimJ/RimL family protein N-acetyltransferase